MVNKVHKRALRTVYENRSLSLQELLSLDNSVSIHVRHLQFLMTETYKSLHHKSPEIMCNLFELKNRPYHLRGHSLLKLPSAKTTTHGTNSLIFKASLLWNSLPNKYKDEKSIDVFKNNIKNWLGSSCTCSICR